MAVPADLQRTSAVLTHPVFNTHHTELELQRYIKPVGEQGLQHDARHDPPGFVHHEAERR
jgi:glycine dehydrogenase